MHFQINRAELQALLENFYTLTHMRIVVFDDEFREIASYPNRHSTFCRILRESDAARAQCRFCDREACVQCRRKKSFITYRCHAGLTEAVTPIQYERMVIGYIMIGQLLQTDDAAQLWRTVEPHLAACGADTVRLRHEFDRKKNQRPEVILAAAKIMEVCAGSLYLSRLVVLRENDLARRLDQYIEAHLAEDLSAATLCDALGISKNRLYALSEHSYGVGIAEHVRALRMEKAQSLLHTPERRISEVADAVGISDYNYFTKVFKRSTGVTPRAFRKKCESEQ